MDDKTTTTLTHSTIDWVMIGLLAGSAVALVVLLTIVIWQHCKRRKFRAEGSTVDERVLLISAYE